MASTTATIEVLTAEVRVLKVGSRQVTLSVYRQLDRVNCREIEPFGRVNDGHDDEEWGAVYVVGKHRETDALVRAYCTPGQEPVVPLDMLVVGHADYYGWAQDHHITGQVAVDDRLSSFVAHKFVRCEVRGCTHFGHNVPRWTFVSPEAKDLAEQRVRAMRRKVAIAQQRYDDWQAQPLIVLAGLR